MITRYLTLIALCISLLAGCGGNSSPTLAGNDPGVGGTGNSDEGIGGTGIGTVTGFGSIIINGTREFDVDNHTVLRIDGQVVSESDFVNAELGLGLVVSYVVGSDVNADFTRGTLKSIDGNHLLRGPVTQLNPLAVLDQIVVVTGSTVLRDANGLPLNESDLKIGDIVAISGFGNPDNAVQSTRLQRENDGREWRLSGIASNVVPGDSFNIDGLLIRLNGQTPKDCGDGLRNGDLVEVKIQGSASYQPGDEINTVNEVECKNEKLEVPPTTTGPLPAEIEGVISSIQSATEFMIGGQRIRVTAATRFKNGSTADLTPGALVEVEGNLTPATGILDAEEIELKNSQDSSENGNGDDNENDGENENTNTSGDEGGELPSSDDSGNDDSSSDDSGSNDSDDSDAGNDNSSNDDSSNDDSGSNDSGSDDSGSDDSGSDDSGSDDSGSDDSGSDDSDGSDSGGSDSGGDNSGGNDDSEEN